MHRDHTVLPPVALDDGDHAGLDDEEVIARVALAEEDLTGLDGAGLPNRADALELAVGEAREGAAAIGRLGQARAERLAGGQ